MEIEVKKYRIEYPNGVVQEQLYIPLVYDHDFFYLNSPLAKAITTGILSLPKNQGGDIKVKMTEIKI